MVKSNKMLTALVNTKPGWYARATCIGPAPVFVRVEVGALGRKCVQDRVVT
jgi:hypothetical protein